MIIKTGKLQRPASCLLAGWFQAARGRAERFFDEGIPLAAAFAFAIPFGMSSAAGLTDELGSRFSHSDKRYSVEACS